MPFELGDCNIKNHLFKWFFSIEKYITVSNQSIFETSNRIKGYFILLQLLAFYFLKLNVIFLLQFCQSHLYFPSLISVLDQICIALPSLFNFLFQNDRTTLKINVKVFHYYTIQYSSQICYQLKTNKKTLNLQCFCFQFCPLQKTTERLHQGYRQLLNVAQQTTDSCGLVDQPFALISGIFLMFSVSYFFVSLQFFNLFSYFLEMFLSS